MALQHEIELLEVEVKNCINKEEQANLILELLNKLSNSNDKKKLNYIDQLLVLANELHELQYKAWAILFTGQWKRINADNEEALKHFEEAKLIFQSLNHQKGIINAYNGAGLTNFNLCHYEEALSNYLVALKLSEESMHQPGIASSYNNIAFAYWEQGKQPEAMKSLYTALKLWEEIGDKAGIGACYNNIGNFYKSMSDYPMALENYKRSLLIQQELGNKNVIASVYNNIGLVYFEEDHLDKAFEQHQLSLAIKEEIGDLQGIAYSYNNLGIILFKQGKLEQALENCFAALQIKEKSGDLLGIAFSHNNIGNVYHKLGRIDEAQEQQCKALAIAEKIGNKIRIKESTLLLTEIYKAKGDYESALLQHEKFHQIDKEIEGEQTKKQLVQLNFLHNLEQKEKNLEIEQLRNVELKKEKDRSESLLLNILPAEVAEELKEKGSANAKLFEEVSVMFTDFVGFTNFSERLSAQELVDELHTCFSAFDEITLRYNIEKIKTVGDAYLAISGLPLADVNHAENMVMAAMEICEYMQHRKKLLGDKTFEIRIGINSGSVVAGIVGIKKFAYDIWGDTVNTAARMEQHSEPGKINISESTYQLVNNVIECTYRGEINAKNKGKLKMYFIHK